MRASEPRRAKRRKRSERAWRRCEWQAAFLAFQRGREESGGEERARARERRRRCRLCLRSANLSLREWPQADDKPSARPICEECGEHRLIGTIFLSCPLPFPPHPSSATLRRFFSRASARAAAPKARVSLSRRDTAAILLPATLPFVAGARPSSSSSFECPWRAARGGRRSGE